MNFNETLKAAIADILAHGYDSRERVSRWLDKLYAAAKASLIPEAQVQQQLAANLANVFRRATDTDKLMKRHLGLSRYTIEQLKPALRHELDRRILASANLIKLNREESIRRTLKRFEGWSTAIPAGGTRTGGKREIDAKLKRSFASLPFEERCVVIDQGHKLLSAVNSIVAENSAAIACVWHSHWREIGYDYRPAHKQFDDHIFVIRNNWAIKGGFMKLDGRRYTDEIEQPAELPFCRCYYSYLYNLADLPVSMLTAKGKESLLKRRRTA